MEKDKTHTLYSLSGKQLSEKELKELKKKTGFSAKLYSLSGKQISESERKGFASKEKD